VLLRAELDLVQSKLDTFIDDLGTMTSFDLPSIEDLSDEFDNILSYLPNKTGLSPSISIAIKKLPAFYCKKGKLTMLPNKGKCLTGYSKVSIVKN